MKNNEILSNLHLAAISYSKLLEYEYIVQSKLFKHRKEYLIRFHPDNFFHLTGIDTRLHPVLFYEKALNNELTDVDLFPSSKRTIKYVLKKKIKNLVQINNFFNEQIEAEEEFQKGVVYCLLATSNSKYTLGFIANDNEIECRPRTIMDQNQLNEVKIIKNVTIKKHKNNSI